MVRVFITVLHVQRNLTLCDYAIKGKFVKIFLLLVNMWGALLVASVQAK